MAAFLKTKSAYSPDLHEEVIWRTALWNRPKSGQRKADSSYAAFYEAFKRFVKFRSLSEPNLLEEFCLGMRALDKELGFTIPGDVVANIVVQESLEDQGEAEKFANWASWVCIQMRKCSTRRGYLGQVPNSSKVGDVICVIAGAAVPFTIRPKGKEYQLIGQCYLHGFMEGEALQDPHARKEDIVLV